jgi:dTDP-4-dehydrorhamnose 3,5-epimerase
MILEPLLIKSKIFNDSRGFFSQVYLEKIYKFKCKFTAVSFSKKNVIRGLHFQKKNPQIKFITLLSGRAIDICVNIDKKSKNFGKVYKFKLKPGLLLFIPKNFAHGIGFYEKKNILLYHLSEYRSEKTEGGILYNDKTLNIKWGIKKPILSKRDKNHPPFNKI